MWPVPPLSERGSALHGCRRVNATRFCWSIGLLLPFVGDSEDAAPPRQAAWFGETSFRLSSMCRLMETTDSNDHDDRQERQLDCWNAVCGGHCHVDQKSQV